MARLVLEFDPARVFEVVTSMSGNINPLGCRLAEMVLMNGQPGFLEQLGAMAVYGITVVNEAETVKIPTSYEEAHAMKTVAENWLKSHADDFFDSAHK